MAKAKNETELSYEEAVLQLESIVKQMESGNLMLSESVKVYEEGIRLIKYCEEELNKYEKLISSLAKETENCAEVEL